MMEGRDLNNLVLLLLNDGGDSANKVNSRHFAFLMIFSDGVLLSLQE